MLKSNFERIIANIRIFQQLKKKRGALKPEIYFNYVTQRSNAADMPAFVELASDLGVKFVNFIHLIDGDAVVDKADNLINYPDLLVPNILAAQAKASPLGVVVNVSPAYEGAVAKYSGTVNFRNGAGLQFVVDHAATAPA